LGADWARWEGNQASSTLYDPLKATVALHAL
jgi:hypothetical protein